MSQELENVTSLQLVVARELARSGRPFRFLKKRSDTNRSNLESIYSEELEPNKQHPHSENSTGFS